MKDTWIRYLSWIKLDKTRISQLDIIRDMFPGYWTGIKEDMKDFNRITLADMNMDISRENVLGYIWIWKDILVYLNWISFLGYDFQSCPNSQKISLNILAYPYISYHILSYPKISSGANSQMARYGLAIFLAVTMFAQRNYASSIVHHCRRSRS